MVMKKAPETRTVPQDANLIEVPFKVDRVGEAK
jgi:hypothetical protein